MRIGYDGKRAVQNFTGLGNYSRYVVQSLSAFAPENEYWLYAPVHRENQQLSSMVAESRGTVSVHYPSYWLWRGMTSLWRVGGIRRTLKRDNIRLFHGLSNELPLTIHRVREVKSVVTVHDLIFLRLSHCFSLVDRLIYNYKCRYACKHADHIIAVSECTKRDIIHYYGIPADKISVIYQGCSSLYACRVGTDKRKEVMRSYRLPERYILSVGTIEERKNALAIVKALEYLPDELHFVLVGRPSVYEGFGIPILEALHSGIPVVAATGSCLEEAGGEHSLYVSPHDVEGLAAAIARTQEPSLRATMIEEGLKWAQRFTEEQMARETMECYRKVLTKET